LPAGGYLVTGIYLPGRVISGRDDRGKAFRLYGQGTGEAFVINAARGTWVKSITNAPVLQDYKDGAAASNGSVEIDNIRFDGTSTTPVVFLQTFFGLGHMHDCVVFQRGVGDGIKITSGATCTVERIYSLNKDWVTSGLGSSRVGIGFNIVTSQDQGLLKISKCTSRGFLTGYNIGGGAGAPISYKIEHCECSIVYNGIILASNTNKAVVSDCYLEGGDGGIGINNLGSYNTIENNLIFAGFSTVIQDLSTTNQGSLIQGNVIALAAVVNAKGVAVASSSAFGGNNKNVVNNSIVFTDGTAGVTGLQLSGASPRITILGNFFSPRGPWTGTGTKKFDDQSTGQGPFGVITQENGDYEIPVLANGALSLFSRSAVITETSVAANVLTLLNGSYFVVTATVATTVQKFSAGNLYGRVVIFRTTNANMTFADSTFIQTAAGAAFTGPGTITFFIDTSGANNIAYEIARTVF
jgi:hypothetical protein